MKKQVFIKTYGCQMNVYDSERMADVLSNLGFAQTQAQADADLVILNTCHIREKAEEKVFSDLGRARNIKQDRKETGKDTMIAVAGCVAQAEGGEILRRAPYVDMIFGPQTYHRLPEMLARVVRSRDNTSGPNRGVIDVEFPEEVKFDHLPAPKHVTNGAAFLSIQEGCDKFCTFCVVPYTRGAEYSRPAASILQDVKTQIALGAKEITLLGQNVNAYHGAGMDGKDWTLGRLIYALAELDGLERLRYTTSHPRDVNQELIDAHRDVPQLMPFLHLPVQSGSDEILERMNRKHTRDFYRRIIDQLRDARPTMGFSSDFIVGFPGESERHFEDTLNLVREVGYGQAYSFKYSPRAGTPGALYEDQVPEAIMNERLSRLQNVLQRQQEFYNSQSIGKTIPVLFDRTGKREGQLLGRTPHMQSVYAKAPSHLLGQIIDVDILGSTMNSLNGTIVI